MLKLEEARPGMVVTYVPYHAHDNAKHKDCERGEITSVNDKYIFVKFRPGSTSQACLPDQLVRG